MSTSQVVVSFGSSVIALLGGGGVILVAICGFLSKFVADRTIEGHKAALNVELERVKSDLAKEGEAHKLNLRKAELLFERELQATSEFSALYHRIRPDYSRPDMEWEDACDAVAALPIDREGSRNVSCKARRRPDRVDSREAQGRRDRSLAQQVRRLRDGRGLS